MMEMTRAEYMKWCKMRALEYVDAGQLDNAISSILSDFTKHPETKPLTSDFGMLGLVAQVHHRVRGVGGAHEYHLHRGGDRLPRRAHRGFNLAVALAPPTTLTIGHPAWKPPRSR
jgi:hypothetical protein